ncbi:MAG: hypothetical protein M3Z29_14475 [Pseudomonadota bacterium]|nr:hypothetical protein [Pseudomonadota bacterium]
MLRLIAGRANLLKAAPAFVLVAATAAAATFTAAALAAPTVSNGGARQWIAFDPDGRTIGPVQFLSKTISIVNTSNVANKFTIFYEPQHLAICGGTLGAGGATLCGVQSTQHLSGGYFQVIATEPVLMSGHSDVPVIRYFQESPTGPFGADPSTGVIQNIPFVWQQGCPPRPGSGCPDGTLVGGTGGAGRVGGLGGTDVRSPAAPASGPR